VRRQSGGYLAWLFFINLPCRKGGAGICTGSTGTEIFISKSEIKNVNKGDKVKIMESGNHFDLNWILPIIKQYKKILILGAVLVGGITLLISLLTPPLYDSTLVLMVDNSRHTSVNNYNDLAAGELLAQNYSQMINNPEILNETIKKISLSETVSTLKKSIKVENVANTQLIKLTVTDSNPAKAALIANTIAEIFSKYIQDLNTERYSNLFADNKEKKDALQAKIDQTEAQIDSLSAKKVAEDNKLAKFNNLISGAHNDYQQIQQSYQNLQLIASQIKGKAIIVDSSENKSDNGSYFTYKTTFLIDQGTSTDRSLSTYIQIMNSQIVLEAVIKKLGIKDGADTLRYRMKVEQVAGSQMIQMSYSDTEESNTTLVAQAIAEEFVNHVRTMVLGSYAERLDEMQKELTQTSTLIEQYQQEIGSVTTGKVQIETDLVRANALLAEQNSDLRSLEQDYNQLSQTVINSSESVLVIQQAEVSTEAMINRPLINTVVGLLAGFLLALIGVAVLEASNNKIKTRENIKQIIDVDTISLVGRIDKNGGELVLETQKLSPVADDFCNLGTNLRLNNRQKRIKTLMVTSPSNNDGKTVVAANLALEMAHAGMDVILVDADLRIPRLHDVFAISANEDLISLLSQPKMDLDGHLQETHIEHIKILTSGVPYTGSKNLINFVNWPALLQQLEQKADLIIIDSMPILSVADTKVIAAFADNVLLVFRANQTQTRDAMDAIEYLQKAGSDLAGIVLNDYEYDRHRYYQNINVGKKEIRTPLLRSGVQIISSWPQTMNISIQNWFGKFNHQ
jgi:capsular exopolysaccharide synthesis family protein